MRARLRAQDFATGKSFSFNQCHNKQFCVFSQEISVFGEPDINTLGVGRILSQILITPLMFISGYANTENVFYCLNASHVEHQCQWGGILHSQGVDLGEGQGVLQKRQSPHFRSPQRLASS